MRFLVFGYTRDGGPPEGVVNVVDCRMLNDPQKHPQYRRMTGADPIIQDHVRASEGFNALWIKVTDLLTALPDDAVVAFGCAFGKHRSRAVAHLAAQWLRDRGRPVEPIKPYIWMGYTW